MIHTSAQLDTSAQPLTPDGLAVARRMEEVLADSDDGAILLGAEGATDKLQWHGRGMGHASFLVEEGEAERAVRDGEEPTAAVLLAFGKLSTDNFWLTSTCGYAKPNIYTKSLVKAKGNALLVAPGIGDTIDEVFRLVVQQLDLLRDNVDPDSKKEVRGAVEGKGDLRGVKLRHVLFERIDDAEKAKLLAAKEDPNEQLGDSFKMCNWHCPNLETRGEMDVITQQRTHRAVPMRAYDVEGTLISPGDYVRKLAGAVVEARFTLSHYKIQQVHYASADIARLDVLVPPVLQKRPGPLKRSPGEIEPESPKKKKARLA